MNLLASMLYAAAWRASRAMGVIRLITYTLAEEAGTSLKAAGWREVGKAGGGTWNRPNTGRLRVDKHPTGQKTLWEVRKQMNRLPTLMRGEEKMTKMWLQWCETCQAETWQEA